MSLADLIRKRKTVKLASDNSANAANDEQLRQQPLARLATLALANSTEVNSTKGAPVGAGDTPSSVIVGDTERIAIDVSTDDRITCRQCLNRRHFDGLCKVAAPTKEALVIAERSYTPDPLMLRRCEGYQPKSNDPDQRIGEDRWAGLSWNGTDQETQQ